MWVECLSGWGAVGCVCGCVWIVSSCVVHSEIPLCDLTVPVFFGTC